MSEVLKFQRTHLRKRDELRIKGQAALDFLLREVLLHGLVLDSNIWMNGEYEAFFEVLDWLAMQGYGANPTRRLILPKVQFDEICLKKTSTEFGTPSNQAARIALGRIERLQVSRLLQVDASFEAERRHGDPQLLKLLSSLASDGVIIRFVSDDMELRIRAREILSKYSASKWKFLEMKNDILPECDVVIAASKVGANPSFLRHARTKS